MDAIDSEYDLVVVGSGAGSVVAALVAQRAGRSVVILEKEDKIGGSTALSGGVAWIPNNPAMLRAGMKDSFEDGLTYLDACAGDPQPGSTAERRIAYVKEGPKAVAFLESYGLKLIAAPRYSDYHEGDLPCARPGGRSLIAEFFDLNELGPVAKKFRRHPPESEAPVSIPDLMLLQISGRTLASKLAYLRVGWRILQNKLGRQIVGMGAALQGRLLKIALQQKIPIVTEAKVEGFIVEGGRVTGVNVTHEGRTRPVKARQGVLINAGGFARNQAMRERYHVGPTSTEWSLANPGDTGEMIEQAQAIGAGLNLMDLCVWNTASLPPGGRGASLTYLDAAKPHAIMVDQTGQRYVDEATSYVAVGLAMTRRHSEATPSIPSWIIFDASHRKHYFLAGRPAGKPPQEWLDSGFLVRAGSLEELADKCRIPRETLLSTVSRFNGFVREGVDRDFNRGRGAYEQLLGDQSIRPNPNLGAIETAPFYAVKGYPGDVGTFGGIVTDEKARVLKEDGSVIPGLYATGNSTATVVGRSYPGAGASIGAGIVFGYLAARDAVGAND